MHLSLRHIPFVFLLLPLLIGIFGAYWASVWLFVGLLVCFVVGLLVLLWIKRLSIKEALLYILIVGLISSFAYMHTQKAMRDTQLSLPVQAAYYQVQLTDFPAPKANTVLCNAQLQYRQDSLAWTPIDGNIKLYLHKDSASLALQQGDIIVVETHLQQPALRNPEDFDYMRYLRLIGYAATGYVGENQWSKVAYEPLRGIRAKAVYCRHMLYNIYKQVGLQNEELAIVSALTLGYTEDMDSATRQSFSVAGAAHILAVSGLHTAIIYAVLYRFLTLFGLFPLLYHRKRHKAIITWTIIVLLWFYAFLAGLTPSILRSVLMLSLWSIGRMRYYRTNTYNILSAAAFIELSLYPLHIFTASFILSYAAVLAIVYLQPRLERLYTPKRTIGKWAWELLTVSTVAQVGVLPWTLYIFGQTSNYFALTNFTILPLSYLIMALAVCVLLFSWIPVVGTFLGYLLRQITALMLWGVQTIEHLPFATSHLQLTIGMLIIMLSGILLVCMYGYSKRWVYLGLSVVCIGLMVGLYAHRLTQESEQEKLIAFSSRPHTTLLYQQGRRCMLLTDDSVTALHTTANYRRYHYLQEPTIQLLDSAAYSFRYQEQDFLIINHSTLENKTLSSPFFTDVLLVGNIGRVSISRLLQLIHAKEVVALSTLSRYKTQQLHTQLAADSIPFHDLHTAAHEWSHTQRTSPDCDTE